ncbi:MAG: DUF2141 domain-containing protein [Rhodocyclaceae bacterium]|jgi:uncharacterized protein (DUF2141 family)|nr:DUF2141 domain-containing protein [Rhodocyclaceae bacterium]
MMLRRWFVLALLGVGAAGGAHAGEASLVVRIDGIRHERGALRVSLYRDPKTFRKEPQATAVQQVAAAPGQATVGFAALPPGRYAVMAYHDEDGNGELNRRFGMFPTEGWGLSNNPTVIGPPAFDDSAFEVVAPSTAVTIELSY